MDRNPKYRRWLRERECVCCRALRASDLVVADSISYAAHTSNNGMRSKGPDSGCAPLCLLHHDQYDGRAKLPNGEFGGHANFERFYGLDMKCEAAAHFAVFLIDSGSDTDIQ